MPSESVEGEVDVSYVYSVWAPMSVRIVQCVAMKGAVLAPITVNNPAPSGAWGESAGADPNSAGSGEGGSARGAGGGGRMKVRAHPIVGWRGFEDIVASIPGETVDVVQSSSGPSQTANGGSGGLNTRA